MGIDTMANSEGNWLSVGAAQAQQQQTFVNRRELDTGSADIGIAFVSGTTVHVSIVFENENR